MRLSRSRLALAQAQLALETLRSVAEDASLLRAYFVATMAILRRVVSAVHEEARGHHRSDFADWWRTTSRDPLHVYVAGVRDPVLKRTESGKVVDDPEASPTVRWTFSSGAYAGSDALAVLEEYLHWLETELVPGAERRTK